MGNPFNYLTDSTCIKKLLQYLYIMLNIYLPFLYLSHVCMNIILKRATMILSFLQFYFSKYTFHLIEEGHVEK